MLMPDPLYSRVYLEIGICGDQFSGGPAVSVGVTLITYTGILVIHAWIAISQFCGVGLCKGDVAAAAATTDRLEVLTD